MRSRGRRRVWSGGEACWLCTGERRCAGGGILDLLLWRWVGAAVGRRTVVVVVVVEVAVVVSKKG